MSNLSHPEMMSYFETVLRQVFEKTRVGLAFNLMSTQVDWERDDLFHVPLDSLASMLTGKLRRHFYIRHDYGLYEYTTYVYRGRIAAARTVGAEYREPYPPPDFSDPFLA